MSIVSYIFKRDSMYKAAVYIYSMDTRLDHTFGYNKKGNEIRNVFQTEKLFYLSGSQILHGFRGYDCVD